ncbi:MAG: translesion DNA synthesis-associated protein ImuA [Acidovorax sp.]|uniref:translesion DNA synthesis-associated protein ImuA n=1 Tax=Acidovorax sp. TaxID=1872122 RepID=UPI000A95FE54|nr:translesion DNA synthesis-associated protein ImuA [Acidovorax sp.]MCO4093916.1 translesion DNA synthesis-associated protein ImuA [Acidovorax sp.]MDH4446625.1 translesion DNA synthesis-associated protein ImuA [Acidovorax sp.]MDH4463252.1 translesion DNA synthesis-associated protein ImuA [Acidovorax sp.]
MSAPLPAAFAAFDPGAMLAPHVAEALWRGTEVNASAVRTVRTGFDALDAQLPGGGWPTHSLTEVLTPQAAFCEWRLLGRSLPALMQDGGRLYLIAPPKQPHAGGLAQLGVTAEQVLWIDASKPVDRLWVTEQILKSGPAGAVLAWLPQARPEQLRRLQIHAQSCDAPVFLFRPLATLADASPAPLRITVAPAQGWDLEVRIAKRRGSCLDESLYLPAMPGNLADVIPPRLHTVPAAPAVAPSREEASHARALGRIAPPAAARVPVSH